MLWSLDSLEDSGERLLSVYVGMTSFLMSISRTQFCLNIALLLTSRLAGSFTKSIAGTVKTYKIIRQDKKSSVKVWDSAEL